MSGGKRMQKSHGKLVCENVCNEEFGSTVSCSSLTNDDYPLAAVLKGGQFMTEPWVKTPVSVTVKFSQTRQVIGLSLRLNVKSHKTLSASVFSLGQSQSVVAIKVAMFNPQSTRDNNEVHFWDYNFMSIKPEQVKDPIKFWKISPLRSTAGLTIQIQSASSIPCFGNLRIWCSRYNPIKAPNIPPSKSSNLKAAEASSSETSTIHLPCKTSAKLMKRPSRNLSDVEESIPSSLIDPITCIPMCIPFLLPSGQNVDRDTLRKYNDQEALRGRQPNDPFTGVPFARTTQPVFNADLKRRLDTFWRDHPQLADTAPRTVAGPEFQFKLNSHSDDASTSAASSDGPPRSKSSRREEKPKQPVKTCSSDVLKDRPSFL